MIIFFFLKLYKNKQKLIQRMSVHCFILLNYTIAVRGLDENPIKALKVFIRVRFFVAK